MSKPTIYLSFGHGGLDANDNYTTAPAKMYNFTSKNYIAYEGVMNRTYGTFILDELTSRDFPVVKVMHMTEDTPLKERVELANKDYVEQGRPPSLYLSLHNDAEPLPSSQGEGGTAYGTSIWTGEGRTFSDTVATSIYGSFKKQLPERHFRTDFHRDGDADKEANFYELRKTLMPAVLIELVFFTTYQEILKFYNPDFLPRVAKAVVDGIEYAYETNKR